MVGLNAPIGGAEETVVCPNCGNRQTMSAVDARCDRCGTLLDDAAGGEIGSAIPPAPAPSDPDGVPPPMVAGGIGGTNDGTQVTRHPPTAVPGKPMSPIADDPAGTSTDEGRALDAPSSPARTVGGGSA